MKNNFNKIFVKRANNSKRYLLVPSSIATKEKAKAKQNKKKAWLLCSHPFVFFHWHPREQPHRPRRHYPLPAHGEGPFPSLASAAAPVGPHTAPPLLARLLLPGPASSPALCHGRPRSPARSPSPFASLAVSSLRSQVCDAWWNIPE
jgi:hypothetical protein